MESNRDGVDSTRQNRKFEPHVDSLEQRVVLNGSQLIGPIPPNIELLEGQTQIIVAIGTTQIYPGFLIPNNILGNYVNDWGDPIWSLDDLYNSNEGSLVDFPNTQLPSQPAPTPAPAPTVAPAPVSAPAPAPIPSWMEADMSALATQSPLARKR